MKKPLSYTPKKPLIYPPKKPLPDTVKKPLAYTLSATLLMASLTACGNQADDAVSTDKSQQLSAEQAVYALESKDFKIDTTKFTKEEFLGYCNSAYNTVWRNPDINYAATYGHLEAELMWLDILVENETGQTCTEAEENAYIAWREATHPNPKPEFEFKGYPKSIKVSEDAPFVGDLVAIYSEPCMNPMLEIEYIAKGVIIGKAEATYGSDNMPVWFKFEYNGNTVYLPAECTDDCNDTEDAEDELFKSVNETVYATEKVNIRESYSATSTKLGQLTKGQSVTRIGIGQGEVSDWSQVRLSDGTIAYINSKYLSTTKPATAPSTSKPSNNTTGKPTNKGGSTSNGGTYSEEPDDFGNVTAPKRNTNTTYKGDASHASPIKTGAYDSIKIIG